MACIFMVVATTLITVGMKLISNSAKESKQAELYTGEAENVARAGLIDTMGWFRRQSGVVKAFNASTWTPGQVPVTTTNPQTSLPFSFLDQPFQPVNNNANAQKSDTLDATIGIVNEYSLSTANILTDPNVNFVGRYEVRRVQSAEMTQVPITTPVATEVPGIVRDVTGKRTGGLVKGDGIVWSVTSTGYVYNRVDKSLNAGQTLAIPFNQYPNKVVATAKVTTEFRKFTVNLPTTGGNNWLAAVYCTNANKITLPTDDQGIINGAVSATTYAVAALSQAPACSSPVNKDTNNCQGGITCMSGASGTLADSTVFGGLSLSDVQFLADNRGDANNPLNIQGDWKLSYYSGSVTFGGALASPYDRLCVHGTNGQESSATGILVVDGDLILLGGNQSVSPPILASSFEGIVFCTGQLTVKDGSSIQGCVIMGTPASPASAAPGQVVLSGSPGAFGEIYLNPSLVNLALAQVATYREDMSARKTLLSVPGLQ